MLLIYSAMEWSVRLLYVNFKPGYVSTHFQVSFQEKRPKNNKNLDPKQKTKKKKRKSNFGDFEDLYGENTVDRLFSPHSLSRKETIFCFVKGTEYYIN